MGENTQSAAENGDAADESLDGVRIEAIASSVSSDPEKAEHADGPVSAPGWTRRISTRGKLARALIIALAVIAMLVTLLRPTFTVPPGIARLLTPVPTQTLLPGAFMSGPWEQISGPPIPAGTYYALTASPTDPATAYACVFIPSADAPGVATSGAVVWVTHDAGQTWREAILPTPPGPNCAVSPALDGSPRVTMSVDDPGLDQHAQACAHSRYFLSEDDGATWRRLQHRSIAPPVSEFGYCMLWGAGSHLFLATDAFGAGDQGRSFLERSDDGGLSWARADQELAEVSGNWYAQPLDATGETLGALIGSAAVLWITHDAGASWQRIGPITRGAPETGTPLYLRTDASLGGGPKACHCVFALSSSTTGGGSTGQHIYTSHDDVYTSHDDAQWSPLPPIPVTGTSAVRSGVSYALGTTVDGKLLALGAEPSAGLPDLAHPTHGPPPRLWAWNTHAGRWELAETRVPCQDLQTCTLYAAGSSAVVAADGTPEGTMFWLTGVVQAGESQTPPQAAYRLYIPAD